MSSAQVFEIAFRLGGVVDSSLRNAFNNASSGLSDMGGQSKLASGSMKLIGAAAVTAAAGITGLAVGLGAAVKASDEFNTSMQQIQASTNTSAAEMAEIKKMSTNLYNKNLGEDWNDLAESISAAKSVTGLTGKELEKATANALVYRDVFGEDVSQSIKATDTMMKNFGISSTEAYNLMAQGAKDGLNKSDELLDTANEYSPSFKALGFSANQMFDTFSAGMKSGAFNLDKVGDAVKEFNIRSKDGSEASAEAYQALGMDAAKMTQTFAAGGPEAQKAFKTVVQAISSVEDPAKKNAIAVGLFGTQAEDLEKDVIAAMGTARSQFDMTRMTMEDIKNIKYDTFSMAWQGIGRQIETGVLIPIGNKVLPILTSFSKTFATVMPAVSKYVESSMGKIGSRFSSVFNTVSNTIGGIVSVAQTVFTMLKPVIGQIVSFITGVASQIIDFWNTDGAQIIQAVKNVFAGISAIIKFLAPAILFIINMVWTNVKGVIQGALNVIIGIVKVFSGLFTGDFGKMWEGVKQIFFGAIQFVWNYVNLLFVGRILGGIKAFATNALAPIRSMWATIKGFFTGGVNNAWTQVVNMGTKVKQGFTIAKNAAVSLASQMWSGVRNHFNNIVSGARALPGRIGDGIKAMAGKALSGITTLGNKLLTGIGKMVNGVIGGLNWVMKKLSVNMTITPWTVPQYAKGTSGHPGGPAILGDGGGPELYRTPQGHMGLSPGTDTLMNLPKGTQVIPARETRMLMSQYNIPAYNMGNVADALNTGKEWLTDKASDVKDTALDVFSYIGEPSKLFNKLLTKFGVGLPDIGGNVGKIASGALSMLKEKGLNFLTEKMNAFSLSGGFGGNESKSPFEVGAGSGFGGMMKYVEYWYNQVKDRFGNTNFMGGYNNRNVRGGSSKSMHAYGRAFDVGGSHQTMSKIAEFMRQVKDIQYVIYNRRISSSGGAWRPYSGVNPHTDHVHADFKGVQMSGEDAHADFGRGGGKHGIGWPYKNSTYAFGAGPYWTGPKGAGMARSAISTALKMTGQPAGYLNGLMQVASHESTYNPNAINKWDVNAQRGDPSIGMFQIIGETFKKWHYPGMDNRRNPLHSAAGAIRYAIGRYGGVMNIPGIRALAAGKGYRPYANGGIVTKAHMGLVGEAGPEAIIPLSANKRGPAMALLLQAAAAMGLQSPRDNNEGGSRLSNLLSYGQSGAGQSVNSGTGNEQKIEYVYSPQITIEGNADQSIFEKALSLSYEEFKRFIERYEADKKRLAYE
jgi:TP901 family phage tail tape measure protein